jgi:hypothetical protein
MFNYKTDESINSDSSNNSGITTNPTPKKKFEKFVFLDNEGLEKFSRVKFALLGISTILLLAILLVAAVLLTIYFYNLMGNVFIIYNFIISNNATSFVTFKTKNSLVWIYLVLFSIISTTCLFRIGSNMMDRIKLLDTR